MLFLFPVFIYDNDNDDDDNEHHHHHHWSSKVHDLDLVLQRLNKQANNSLSYADDDNYNNNDNNDKKQQQQLNICLFNLFKQQITY